MHENREISSTPWSDDQGRSAKAKSRTADMYVPEKSDCVVVCCERKGENPQIAVAAKAETAIEKGFAGPGLLAFIVTSKFADYLPLYRLEDIFERQGFEISRATQSVWCGDVADVVEPLYQRMAERVRKSHVVATGDTVLPMLSPGQTQSARMWVYVGDESNPYNVFDFTLNRSREGPKEFLKDYTQVLLADAYGGYNGVVAGNAITRAGCWSHARRKFVEAEKSAPEIAREAVARIDALFAVERQAKDVSVAERMELQQKQAVPLLAELHRKLLINLPTWPARDLDAWLPDRWKQAHIARCAALGIPIPPNP
jgi:transposase